MERMEWWPALNADPMRFRSDRSVAHPPEHVRLAACDYRRFGESWKRGTFNSDAVRARMCDQRTNEPLVLGALGHASLIRESDRWSGWSGGQRSTQTRCGSDLTGRSPTHPSMSGLRPATTGGSGNPGSAAHSTPTPFERACATSARTSRWCWVLSAMLL